MNSNWNGRFPRTYREATGQAFYLEGDAGDRAIGWTCALIGAFLVGLWLGVSF